MSDEAHAFAKKDKLLFAEALARCRRVQEYEKTKKGGGTKEVDLTVKNRLGPNPKRELNKELEIGFAGFIVSEFARS
ncbi:hypothetical protein Tco_0661458 [Tanacetum coccineum]